MDGCDRESGRALPQGREAEPGAARGAGRARRHVTLPPGDTVPEVAAGLNAWAAHIEGLLTERPAADVVPIRAKRRRTLA